MNFFRISDREVLYKEGSFRFFHNGKGDFSGAYEISEKASLSLNIPRALGATEVFVSIHNESITETLLTVSASWTDLVGSDDIYSVELPIRKIGVGLYFISVKINFLNGSLYAGAHGNKLVFSREKSSYIQLSVSEFAYSSPQNLYGGIIYHIFVDRFYKGQKTVPVKRNTVSVRDWQSPLPEYPEYPGAPLKNNYFYGGTLCGIEEKLEYIKSLGVTMIYLSPIFDSPSNHKYDTADYMTVDSMFGGEKALKHLISSANKHGIGIILDGVFNHTGADSIYFNKYSNYPSLGAYNSKDSEYYSWFDFQSFPDKYTSWWGIEILPRINPDIEDCGKYISGDGGVIEKYANLGIAGFRLDVVDELSDAFIESIKKRLNLSNTQSVIYGEVWEDGSNKIAYGKRKRYYLGKELDGVMNYPIRKGLISYLRDGRTDLIKYALTDVMYNAPKRIRDAQMNLIGSHDTIRAITALSGEDDTGKSNAYLFSKRMNQEEHEEGRKKLIAAYTILATIPGVPCIFYGDEAGMEGYSDPFNRLPYPWGKEDQIILETYRKIGEIRRSNSVYKHGDFKINCLSKDLFVFSRINKTCALVTIVNNSNKEIKLHFSKRVKLLLKSKQGEDITLQPFEAEIIKTTTNTVILA